MNAHFDIQLIATDEVAPDGENVVWCGQPDPVRFAMNSLPIFLFAVPWTAFAMFWMYAASGFEFPTEFPDDGFAFFPLFGLPFVLIGVGMLSSPVFSYAKAFRTVYIITPKTARIVTVGRTKKTEIYAPADIGRIERTEKTDGTGDLIFKKEISYDSRNKQKSTMIGFYGIRDVRIAESHLIGLKKSVQETRSEKE